jgi:hypothetical protein
MNLIFLITFWMRKLRREFIISGAIWLLSLIENILRLKDSVILLKWRLNVLVLLASLREQRNFRIDIPNIDWKDISNSTFRIFRHMLSGIWQVDGSILWKVLCYRLLAGRLSEYVGEWKNLGCQIVLEGIWRKYAGRCILMWLARLSGLFSSYITGERIGTSLTFFLILGLLKAARHY